MKTKSLRNQTKKQVKKRALILSAGDNLGRVLEITDFTGKIEFNAKRGRKVMFSINKGK